MNRLQLIEKLSLCAPALAKTAFMPILNHFWFTGKHVIGFNDQIGIAVPFKTDFVGAVEGDLLLALLRNSRAKEFEMTPIGDNAQHLQIVGGPTKAKLAMLPPEGFMWSVPKLNPEKQIALGKQVEDFLYGIELVMLSVSGDTTIPDQMGITFIPEEGGVGLFSTNHASLSYSFYKLAKKWPARVILPSLFCTQLRALGKRSDISLEVSKNQVIAIINDVGDTKDPTILFTRCLESERPHDFGRQLDLHYTPKNKKTMIPLPSNLKLIAERAFLASQDKKQKVFTNLKVDAGRLNVFTDGVAQIRDVLKLDSHPNAELDITVQHLRTALGAYHSPIEAENGNFIITSRCVIMNQGESVYMLSERDE